MPGKKKGGKKKGGKKKKVDAGNPSRIKKALKKWNSKFINHESRITIIGCSSEPEEGSKKDFKKFFAKAIYFPFPDYTTRRLMWRNFIEQQNGKLKSDFPLSTLAHISNGYSAGSILKTCKKVLTDMRVKNQEQRPLTLAEFIGPLSQCGSTMDEQYETLKGFTDDITGDKKQRDKLKALAEGDDGDAGAKKKKKKGK
jgi:IQ and AAA domain-containing protein